MLVAVIFVVAVGCIATAMLLSTQSKGSYEAFSKPIVSDLLPTTHAAGTDTDGDGLLDIDENYVYGTDPTKVDTDGDGMPDWWEVKYRDARNPDTGELTIDPLNPSDAYLDPDNDGYDFNNNGRIDTYPDSIVRSNLSIPALSQYTPLGVCALAENQLQYDGALVRFEQVAVMENGTYGAASTNTASDIGLRVTDLSTRSQAAGTESTPLDQCSLRVDLTPNSNRPPGLAAWRQLTTGWQAGDIVNIEGLFHVNPGNAADWWLEVRGGEQFTNIQEFETWHDYNGDGHLEGSDPLVRDTDGDGMWDGYEAHYGKGHPEAGNGTVAWVWDFFMSPVNASDAGQDPDGDGIRITWTDLVNACLLRDANGTCIHEVPADVAPGDFVLAGTNLHEFYLHTRPDLPDTDGDTYPPPTPGEPISDWNGADMQEVLVLKTDPTNPDTDGDGMGDGWESYYNLLPLNASDKFEDPDHDLLPNIDEYNNPGCRLNPRSNDTDSDGMPDGWEVKYQLDACRNDAGEDVDLTHGALTPDGLTNLQEFYAGTSPRLVDTDGDNLTDFDEVTKTWAITVDGRVQHFKTDPSRADTDGDGISDFDEVTVYHTNATNPDTDLDGLSDPVELFTDRNATAPGNQTTSPNLKDTDGDGLTDFEEVPHPVNGIDTCLKIYLPGYTDAVQRCTDPLNPDTDGDGLTDGLEVHTDFDPSTPRVDSSDPTNPDTDGDGLNDGYEFANGDIDGDGLPNGWELQYLSLYPQAYNSTDADGNGVPDVNDDWDGDGLTNLQEYIRRTDPLVPDTLGDGVVDSDRPLPITFIPRTPVYSDTDGDHMPDWWEVQNGFNPYDPSDGSCSADADGDGFANIDEYLYNTNPHGQVDPNIPDKWNHVFIANPLSCDDDKDGIANWWETFYGLDPTDPTDADRNLDRELNATGAVDPATGLIVLADNWTNFEEYVYARDPYNHISTNPRMGDSDFDAYNIRVRPDGSFNNSGGLKTDYNKFYTDDVDPDPVILWHSARPTNPSVNATALSPIRKGDASGDMDRDGLNNTVEALKKTSAFDPDTDGDGMPDGWEVQYAYANATTGKPILDPLYPGDANEDPDNDGWNYSRVVDTTALQDPCSQSYPPLITRRDFNGDGVIDNFMDTEQFTNLKEYYFGDDTNGDGINDVTTNPAKRITNADQNCHGPVDGYVQYFKDRDFDQLPRWYEVMFGFNDADRTGNNGGQGDPDLDGAPNVLEYRSSPWTNPRDPKSVPPMCSWPRDFLPDPLNPPPPC